MDYDPMRDTPAFAKANKDRRFGAPNGNKRCDPTAAVQQREFYRWVESVATEDELKEYVKDKSNPYVRRLYIMKVQKAASIRDLHDITNQVHGLPKQTIEMAEPPKIEIIVNGKSQTENQ